MAREWVGVIAAFVGGIVASVTIVVAAIAAIGLLGLHLAL
jgi:hypothetical protein